MTGFDAYKIYIALKLHFTTDYDIKKYKGRTPTKQAAFEKRKDKWVFGKLGQRYKAEELVHLFVSNFIVGDKYGGVYNMSEAIKVYAEFTKRRESIQYILGQSLQSLHDKYGGTKEEFLNKITDCSDGHPIILRWYLGKKLSLEVLLILSKVVNLQSTLDTALKDDIFWAEVSTLINNYRPFLRIDEEKSVETINKLF